MAKFGTVTTWEKLHAFTIVARLPLVILWGLLTSPFSRDWRVKTWRRRIIDSAARYMTSTPKLNQIQFLSPTSLANYTAWAKKNKLPITVDELELDGKLYWVGHKKTGKLLLYIHGGVYHLPLPDYGLSFCLHVQKELEHKSVSCGVAALDYGLLPDYVYPSQLRQTVASVHYLVHTLNVDPQDIILMGDSCGANLILSFVSHILHPLPDVPAVDLKGKALKGSYLMSPWISLSEDPTPRALSARSDFITPPNTVAAGRNFMRDVPPAQRQYGELTDDLPEGWFNGIDTKAVEHVLITVGDKEYMLDQAERTAKAIPSATMLVQKDGIHDDPLLDFMAGDSPKPFTYQILEWLEDRFH